MSETSQIYCEKIGSLLTAVEKDEQDSIDRAAVVLAKTVAEGRMINVIGTGGHSNLAAEEVIWRAGGLAAVNPLLDPGISLGQGAKRSNFIERTPGYAQAVLDSYELTSGDVLVIVNAYGFNALTIDCALECKKRGLASIGVTSVSFTSRLPKDSPIRHPSGKNLHELVDVFIDSHMPYGDSVVEVSGVAEKMGPTSTILNAFVMHLLMMRTAEKLLEKGIHPPVWLSGNLPDGDQLNKKYEDEYGPRIKHFR